MDLRGPQAFLVVSPGLHDLLLRPCHGAVLAAHRLHLCPLARGEETAYQLVELLVVALVRLLNLLHQLCPVFLLLLCDEPSAGAAKLHEGSPEASSLLLIIGAREKLPVGLPPSRDCFLDLFVPPAAAELAADLHGPDCPLAGGVHALDEVLHA